MKMATLHLSVKVKKEKRKSLMQCAWNEDVKGTQLRPVTRGKGHMQLQTNNVIVWATKVGQKHLTLYKFTCSTWELTPFPVGCSDSSSGR